MDVRFPGGKRVVAEFDGVRVETDQPKRAGGQGSAPSPFDLFLASLATCTGYYVLTFCQKRDIRTDDITLTLSTTRDEESRMLTRIDIRVQLPEEFPSKYIDACIKAASQCTVKKHLAHPPDVVVSTDQQRSP